MFQRLLLPLLCSLIAMACQPDDDVDPRVAELTASPGLRIKISDAGELPPATVHAIAQHLEGAAQDHGAAAVRVTRKDDDAPVLEIELWGGTLPGGDVPAQLKAAFPALAAASISTATIAPGEAPALPMVTVDKDLSPADAEQQIRDQLAADGVDGEVNVKIEDGPDGRRVEVDVKKTETH
jgi:hypothetical protein